ncbi:ABC transporter ATP-binding protein [Fusibacter bizertensis]|jgi:ABC-type antimicrobial peptide transport system, ATPase component|uniref:ABC transporter ATP-binding protein n=1 Tax=Fusibacter bizertensis TaxID=1488331 RepID=A0ABT6NGJ4_9FIRM|nr:ABC transporter ATP-binding protein [Fusibacter bizertensis]MDH8679526.1 ABC transporter ATP-binding protein [Fusibacter bizertensis]
MDNNIITLSKVSKVYGNQIKTQVLFDIDLNIKSNSFNGIIGASGSGKSTLLNIIGTLDQPTQGAVMIDGVRTDQMKKNALAKLRNETIGFIFQFHYLLPEFTAFENVLMPYYIKGQKIDKKMNARAHELMDLVGLSKVKNNLAGNMSGGQQQRTAIARSLINNPKLILADEPTGNLDSDTTEVVYDLLRDINKQFETTFIVITHDRRIAEKTDRIIEIKDGKIFNDFSRI